MRTITVAKLIDLLEAEDPDALVVFACDYGDICHTEQALPIRGQLEEVQIEENAYSHSGFAITTEDDEENDSKFLVIR